MSAFVWVVMQVALMLDFQVDTELGITMLPLLAFASLGRSSPRRT